MNFNPYWYNYGVKLSGQLKAEYETQDSITFNIDPVTYPHAVTGAVWSFFHSDTGALIKTITGLSSDNYSVTTTFTFAEGINGVDVYVILWTGLNLTNFYIERRVWTLPNCTTSNFTYNMATVGASNTLDLTGVTAGSIVELTGSTSASSRIKLINAPNCSYNNPVVIVAKSYVTITKSGTSYDDALQVDGTVGGTAINGLWFYSRTDPVNGNPYWNINGGGIGANTSNINTHNNVRFIGMKFTSVQASGIKWKGTDNVGPDRFTGGFRYLKIIHVEVDGAGFECFYNGHEGPYGYRFDPGFGTGNYFHAMKDAEYIGCSTHGGRYDGLQLTGADLNAVIIGNYSFGNAIGLGSGPVGGQCFALSAGGGFTGKIKYNLFDGPIQVFPNSDTEISHNVILGDWVAPQVNAIFLRRYDNPNPVGPNGPTDHYDYSSASCVLNIYSNYIKSQKDAVFLLNGNDAGTGIVPPSVFNYVGNTCYMSLAPEQSELKLQGTASPTFHKANYLPSALTDVWVTDEASLTFAVYQNSKVFYTANEGPDLSLYITPPTYGFHDLTGQSYPVNGHYRPYAIQRFKDWPEPQAGITQDGWNKTAQSSIFTDKEAIPDFFDYAPKQISAISGSAKPKMVGSVKVVSTAGTGVENFNAASF